MSERLIRDSRFISFDGTIEVFTSHQKPDRYRHLEMHFGDLHRIARGGGYSFAAASFGENVLVQELGCFDRFIEFDPTNKTVKVEAGMPLGKLLSWAMERELYYPVLPGYPEITVGGCVAADVHGKNPWRDGTFSEWVTAIKLFHPARGYVSLSREENPEVFGLTCGGFGLTGIIVDVTLQLVDLQSDSFEVRKIAVSSLDVAFKAISEHSDRSDFIYSWHDGMRRGTAFGVGLVFIGTWSRKNHPMVSGRHRSKVMTARTRAAIAIPLWNDVTATIANRLFKALKHLRSIDVVTVEEATFPFAYNTLYHRLYGKKGFFELQVLVKLEVAEAFVMALQNLVDRLNPPLVMISIKMFRGVQSSLSMTGEGFLIALNFYQNSDLSGFLELVDHLIVEVGAQPNLSKDSRISKQVASQTIVHYESFKVGLQAFDSSRIYQSELSRRIGI